MDAIYRVDGNRAETSPNAAGPWDASMQHGSAPAALVTWAAEAIPTAVPMQIVRVTIDLMRPVPVAPLTIQSEVLREGRKIQLCAISLLVNNVVVVRATVLKVRADSPPLPSELADGIDTPPDRHADGAAFRARRCNRVVGQQVRGGFLAGAWRDLYRVDRPSSRVRRLEACAPWSPPISATHSSTLTLQMDISQCRPHGQPFAVPVGDWILLNAETWIGPAPASRRGVLAMPRGILPAVEPGY